MNIGEDLKLLQQLVIIEVSEWNVNKWISKISSTFMQIRKTNIFGYRPMISWIADNLEILGCNTSV